MASQIRRGSDVDRRNNGRGRKRAGRCRTDLAIRHLQRQVPDALLPGVIISGAPRTQASSLEQKVTTSTGTSGYRSRNSNAVQAALRLTTTQMPSWSMCLAPRRHRPASHRRANSPPTSTALRTLMHPNKTKGSLRRCTLDLPHNRNPVHGAPQFQKAKPKQKLRRHTKRCKKTAETNVGAPEAPQSF